LTIDLLRSLFTTPFSGILIYFLFPSRYSHKKSVWIILIFVLLQMSCSHLGSVYLSPEIRSVAYPLIESVTGFFLPLVLCKYRDARAVFLAFTVDSVIFSGDLLGVCVFLLLMPHVWVYAAFKFGTYALFLLLTIKTLRRTIGQCMEINPRGWWRASLIPISFFASCYIAVLFPSLLTVEHIENCIPILLLLILLFVVYYIFFDFLELYNQNHLIKREKQFLEFQMITLENYDRSLTESVGKMKVYRHDMKHKFNIIATLLRSGEFDTARQIVENQKYELANFGITKIYDIYCDDPVINSIISFHIKAAVDSGIDVDIQLDIPTPFPVEKQDFLIMFSNAIENAIRACGSITHKDQRKIKLCCKSAGSQILFTLSNTFTGEVTFNPSTGLPCSHESGHGYGSHSIAMFSKKYGGIIDYEAKDGWFTLRLLF